MLPDALATIRIRACDLPTTSSTENVSHITHLQWSSHAVPGISASPYTDNLRYFNVIISGPCTSAYEGGPASFAPIAPLPTKAIIHCDMSR